MPLATQISILLPWGENGKGWKHPFRQVFGAVAAPWPSIAEYAVGGYAEVLLAEAFGERHVDSRKAFLLLSAAARAMWAAESHAASRSERDAMNGGPPMAAGVEVSSTGQMSLIATSDRWVTLRASGEGVSLTCGLVTAMARRGSLSAAQQVLEGLRPFEHLQVSVLFDDGTEENTLEVALGRLEGPTWQER